MCLLAHGTEEGLIPENVLHSCTIFVYLWAINDVSLFGLFGWVWISFVYKLLYFLDLRTVYYWSTGLSDECLALRLFLFVCVNYIYIYTLAHLSDTQTHPARRRLGSSLASGRIPRSQGCSCRWPAQLGAAWSGTLGCPSPPPPSRSACGWTCRRAIRQHHHITTQQIRINLADVTLNTTFDPWACLHY